jgi:glycosyltransferase involved in cell wall biosynthesis
MSAGVTPVVTDIPSFRAIAGRVRITVDTGDAGALANALVHVWARSRSARDDVRAHFERALSWSAIGARTVAEYRVARREAGAMKIAIVVPGGLHPAA